MIKLYVIKSLQKNFRYVGITKHLKIRLHEHNMGYSKSTKLYKPYNLLFLEEYSNYKEARKREKYLKSGQGRKFLDTLGSI